MDQWLNKTGRVIKAKEWYPRAAASISTGWTPHIQASWSLVSG
ncbi:hypothetical protein [Streptomyces sp. NPDC051546]